MEILIATLKKAFIYILDTIFIKRCLNCNKKNEIVCESCLANMVTNETINESYIYSPYSYRESLMKKIIWNLKYYKRKEIGTFFGKILYENYTEEIHEMRLYSLGQSILVLPVPLSKKRLHSRGFNQAQTIAESFCNQTNKNILELRNDILEKVKDTVPQAQIKNRTARLKNAKNAYKLLKKEVVKNRNIIIIDDVFTTGGTINEIKKLLEKSGARKVIGITIAH